MIVDFVLAGLLFAALRNAPYLLFHGQRRMTPLALILLLVMYRTHRLITIACASLFLLITVPRWVRKLPRSRQKLWVHEPERQQDARHAAEIVPSEYGVDNFASI
jgi:hypothetical protein